MSGKVITFIKNILKDESLWFALFLIFGVFGVNGKENGFTIFLIICSGICFMIAVSLFFSPGEGFSVGSILSDSEEVSPAKRFCHCKYTKEECRTDDPGKGQCCCVDSSNGKHPPNNSNDAYLAEWWRCTHLEPGRNRGIPGCVLEQDARAP